MSEGKHTPTPWKIFCYPGTRISMGRVEIIVKAVNAHDQLVEALKDAKKEFNFIKRCERCQKCADNAVDASHNIKVALKAAGEEI